MSWLMLVALRLVLVCVLLHFATQRYETNPIPHVAEDRSSARSDVCMREAPQVNLTNRSGVILRPTLYMQFPFAQEVALKRRKGQRAWMEVIVKRYCDSFPEHGRCNGTLTPTELWYLLAPAVVIGTPLVSWCSWVVMVLHREEQSKSAF